MQIVIKQIHGAEILIDIKPDTTVLDVRKALANKLKAKMSTLTLLLLGKKMANDAVIESIPNMVDGTKIYLIVKKPDTFKEAAYSYFKQHIGMSEEESRRAAVDICQYVQQMIYRMSWDEVNMFCLNALGRDVPEREILERREIG